MAAATNSTSITEAELRGYKGFAKTLQAYELHIVNNLQYQNGIRVDVKDPDNLGGFVTYEQALDHILALLDEAYSELLAGEFAFSLSSGFAGYDTPATFGTFNRALSARIALYAGKTNEIGGRLMASFMNPAGAASPSRFYSAAGGDFANNLFRVRDQADAIIAHPSYVTDAETGDTRLSNVSLRPSGTLSLDDLSGDYDVWVFKSTEDGVPLITNEELMLIGAEANLNIDNAKSVMAINIVRGNAGLGAYSGEMTNIALLEEIVKQRRYSLYGLGHRWVDLRRLGMLATLPLDRDQDDVWEQMPRPASEN
jgi:hypothetical protein